MKTPTDFLFKTAVLLCVVTLFSNCNKNPFADGNGAVTFYVCEGASNCGGSVTAEVEGQRHTMTSFFTYCPTPDKGDETSEGLFRVELPIGSYDYTITAASGGSYSGTVNISEGDLSTVEISGSSLGCSGGGGNCNYTTYSGSNNCATSGHLAVSSSKCCAPNIPYWCSTTGTCYSSCEAAANAGCGNIVLGTSGGGPCNYTTYSGTGNCTGGVAVSSTKCCASSSPYWCSTTGSCYASCEAAESAGCGNIVKGSTGGGGTCNSTTYTGSGSCSSGNVLVASGGGNSVCCPSSKPYYCANTNQCYTSCSAADVDCSGSVKFGNSAGSGSSCDFTTWRTYLSVVSTTRDPLGIGNNNELEVVIRNNANQDMDIRMCLHTTDGVWSCGLELCISPGSTADYMKFTSVYTDLYQYYGRPCGSSCQFPQ